MKNKLSTLGPRHQIAALPWRQSGASVEVLLITSRLSRHWLIPKGWPMKGKSPSAAAAREALEEAGIKGAISQEPVGRYQYDKISLDGAVIPCVVDVYPLLVKQELDEWQEAATRTRSWMPIETASMLAYEGGLSDLLAQLDHNILATGLPSRPKKAARR